MEATRESIRDRILRLNNLLSQSTLPVKSDSNGSISCELLLDSLILLYDECNNEFLMKDPLIADFVEKYRSTVLKLRDICVGISDFEWHKVISVGRFAEVTVVKEKNTDNVYIAKRLRKSDVLNGQDTIHFENEKHVLLTAHKHPEACKWVPRLFYSFHNLKYIYYIMEYCPGGNLYTMLEYYKKNVPESMLRFYMAEMVQAIRSVHTLGFAHRDIKPDNITIDKFGHLKLIDFGSSARIPKNGLINTKISSNIPHYIAPEVFKFHDNQSKGYNAQCDWWSLGVVLFELTTGTVPFTSDEVPKLYLSTYVKKLQYPKLVNIPVDLKNIINNLLQPVDKRLNYDKIRRLDYFRDIKWDCLHERDPLFVPSLSCPEDTSYFTTYENQRPTPKVEDFKLQRRFTGKGLPFLGFTYLGNASKETMQSHYPETKSGNAVRGRRKTEHSEKSIPGSTEMQQRNSLDSATRFSEAATSEYSNDSYESASSDIYSCMSEDQQKILKEKEQLTRRIHEMETEYAVQLEELKNKSKELEDDRENLRSTIKEMEDMNNDLKRDYEEQVNKLKKTDKLKKDAIVRLNADLQKLSLELNEKSSKLRETEEKLLNVSNQQAAKLAMLSKTKTTLRSKSEERDKYEQENTALKGQLAEANKKIAKLTADLEKKNKLKLDLELKMTTKDKNGERTFTTTQNNNEKSTTEPKLDTEQLAKQLENTVRDVLRQNLNNKELEKSPDIENMIGSLQRKISLLSDHFKPVCEAGDKATVDPEVITVLHSQIERLEGQMEKARERAVLSREEATQAKSKLAIVEKQLSDLKIDLRIAQRETKDAENKVKELEEQLSKDTQQYITQLEEHKKLLHEREIDLATLKQALDAKTNEVRLHEASLEDKTSVICSLSKELQSMKTKIENLRHEKTKVESENKKRVLEVNELKAKIEQLKNAVKKNESNVEEIKEKENEWKSKYEKIKAEVESLRETCEIQDRINVGFESKQKKLETELKQHEDEKGELQEKLQSICDELKEARKSINEEKSLRAVAEDKLRKLQEGLRLQEEEIRFLEEDKNEKLHQILTLEEKVKQFEDCIFQTNDSMQKSTQYIELMKKEIYTLKTERTELLTRLHRLKEDKISLHNELTEAIEEINSLQQINGESQLVLDQIKAYYEDRHMKDTATLHQYSKLNEFLQTKVHDATKQKRTFADKFFRSKYKENLNPREIENLLYLERKKNKELTEKLYQTKTEVLMQRSNENSTITKCSSPKNTDYESCISATPTMSKKTLSNNTSNKTETDSLLHARMKHNIPHKFETKLCKKLGIKCVACGQAVTFGHMSQCKECHVRCHVACSVKIGPTCGLSKLLMNHLPIPTPTKAQSSISLGSSVNSDIEGHIRVLKDKSWRKMNVVMDDKKVSFYEKTSKQPKEPNEKINFSSIVDVDDNIDKAHVALENVPDTEKRCLFRIIYRTTNKQEKVLHLLASNETDKLNWINMVRRNLPTMPKQICFKIESRDRSRGLVICKFAEPNIPVVHQMISLLPELALLATDNGLYSLRIDVKDDVLNEPVRINGVRKVTRMKIMTKSRLALFVCEEENLVKKCDLRMLVSNAEAAACSMPNVITEDVSSVAPISNCNLIETSSCNSFLAIATANRLVILKASEMGFDEVVYDKKATGVMCMVFTPLCMLYCTHSEVFRIDLETYHENRLEVFKRCPDGDTKCRQSLKAIVKITRELYLVCNQLFGVFVNADGRRTKNSEMLKWPLLPERIVYNKPFLCLGHESNISLVYLPSCVEESEKKYKFTIVPYSKPTILGIVKEPMQGEYLKDTVRGIFVEDESDAGSKLLYFLDPIAFTRQNPKDSWSSIDTQLTGETTDEECVRKSLNISNETDLSLNSSILGESNGEQSS